MHVDEQTRNEVIHDWQRGQSQRQIAKRLHVSRNTIKAVLDELQQAREGQAPCLDAQPCRKQRASVLDQFDRKIQELVARYPDIQVMEILRCLRSDGYEASYTILRQRVKRIRQSKRIGRLAAAPAPGALAQATYREVHVNLADHGLQKRHLFSLRLLYSGRACMRFCTTTDLVTTMYQHVRAFDRLGGAAASIEYENVPDLTEHRDHLEARLNPTFLRFASHYGFRPVSCRLARPEDRAHEALSGQLQAEVLRGSLFRSLDHANDALAAWLSAVADVLPYRGSRPTDLVPEEHEHLVRLPTNPWRG